MRELWNRIARWLGPVQAAGEDRERFSYAEDEEIDRPFNWVQLRRLFSYIGPYRRLAVASTLVTMVGAAMNLIRPLILLRAISQAIGHSRPGLLDADALAYLASYLLGWLMSSMQIRLTAELGQSVLARLRHHLFAHIMRLSLNFFDSRPAGNILVRVTNDVNALGDLFTNGIVNLLTNVFLLVGIIVVMLILQWKLALASFITIPLLFALSTTMRRHIRQGWQLVRRRLSRINAHLNEAIQGIRVTQAFTREEENRAFFTVINHRYYRTWMGTMRWSGMFGPLVGFTGAIGVAIVYGYGGLLVRSNAASIALIVAFLQYVGLFWQPISTLGNLYNSLLQAMASSERIFQFLDFRPAVTTAADAPQLPSIAGEVTFDHVTFAYSEGRPALDDVSFHVRPGQMVALVGHTGAGKTTVMNLLARFYDPTSGHILIDGHDIQSVSLSSLHQQMAIVLQDTFLFSGTVRDNLRYGHLQASDAEIEQAAAAIGADDFIRQLPQGYDTEVRERGSRLSVGQRQLVSFARALLADPRILILDEATSSIDTHTEMVIQRALERLLAGRTAFVVAHRLSTIRQADVIMVFDHGRIVESGTHQSLLDQDGVYAGLIRAQFRFLDAAGPNHQPSWIEPQVDVD